MIAKKNTEILNLRLHIEDYKPTEQQINHAINVNRRLLKNFAYWFTLIEAKYKGEIVDKRHFKYTKKLFKDSFESIITMGDTLSSSEISIGCVNSTA